mgnify:CR=1 FL=1
MIFNSKGIVALFLILILAITSSGLVYAMWNRNLYIITRAGVGEVSINTSLISTCSFGSADFGIVTIDLFLWLFHFMVRNVFPRDESNSFLSSR